MDHCWFRDRRTEKMRIRRIWKESSHSAFPEVFEVFIIRRWTIRKRRFIEFPVTRMNKSSYWSLDEKTDRVRDRVIHDKWSNLEIFSYLYRFVASIFSDIRESCAHISLLELDELICHRSRIERSTPSQLLHKIVDSSDMIDMSMCDTRSDDFFPTTVRKIRDCRIDTILVLIRKLDSHIDDDHLIFIFKSHTVKTYLFHPTKWNDSKSSLRKRFYSLFFFSEEFLECLSRCKKWIGSLRSEWILKEKWISWTKIRLEFFSRIKKISRSSFWALGCASIALETFISHKSKVTVYRWEYLWYKILLLFLKNDRWCVILTEEESREKKYEFFVPQNDKN